ncbi:MAG: L-histidine N(alpha)-methyltransferase [Bacteroidota bacterium]|nr:L-histidine N(alpha)-methyltransferase [Bacteroidota bacterium]
MEKSEVDYNQFVFNNEFKKDILIGLTAFPKYIDSKYFYDKRGDELFQQIMDLPEYYLTNCELEILQKYKEEILRIFNPTGHFNLIDLGAGDGFKTKILISHFLEQNLDYTYVPVDISSNAVESLKSDLEMEFDTIDVEGISKDYFSAIKELDNSSRKIILFLGANIGNFNRKKAESFFTELSKVVSKEDILIIGFDLKKNPDIILAAYNDKAGVTKDFNLNLLHRINQELGANFDVSLFEHSPQYDSITGEARSFLVSTISQEIKIPALDLVVSFYEGETIHSEISRKYDLQEIENLAISSGFKIIENLLDSKKYFTDSVWKIKI